MKLREIIKLQFIVLNIMKRKSKLKIDFTNMSLQKNIVSFINTKIHYTTIKK